MKSLLLNDPVTWVWLLLAGLTGVSWWLGAGQTFEAAGDYRYTTVSLMLLAFFKIRLVVMYFMEIRIAPLPLRIAFETWVVAVCGAVLTIYLLGADGF